MRRKMHLRTCAFSASGDGWLRMLLLVVLFALGNSLTKSTVSCFSTAMGTRKKALSTYIAQTPTIEEKKNKDATDPCAENRGLQRRFTSEVGLPSMITVYVGFTAQRPRLCDGASTDSATISMHWRLI